jgi:hypothetical protein
MRPFSSFAGIAALTSAIGRSIMGPDPDREHLELALYAVALVLIVIFVGARWLIGLT